MDFKHFICVSILIFIAVSEVSGRVNEVYVPQGHDVRIKCSGSSTPSFNNPIYWWYDSTGRQVTNNARFSLADGGDLMIRNAKSTDSGFYECQVGMANTQFIKRFEYNVQAYKLPKHSQKTKIIYKARDCHTKTTMFKTDSISAWLCRDKQGCEYSVNGQCISKGWSTHRTNVLTITITSTVTSDIAYVYPECRGEITCIRGKIKRKLQEQQIYIDELVNTEKMKRNMLQEEGMGFLSEKRPETVNLECPAGVEPNSKNGICVPCRLGTYSKSGSRKCEPCAKGTYSHKYGMDKCVQCPHDGTTTRKGAWSIQACSIGDKTRKGRAVNTDFQQTFKFSQVGAIGASLGFTVSMVVALAFCAGCNAKKQEKEEEEEPIREVMKPVKKGKSDTTNMVDPNKAYSAYSIPESMASISDVFYEDLETEQIGSSHKRMDW